MAISKRTRFEVFKRDKFTCQYCGRTPPQVILHVDHIAPISRDGPDDPLNLLTSCADCNLGKSAVPLGQVHRPLAEQIAEEKERQEQVAAFNAFLVKRQKSEQRTIETLGRYWFNKLASENECEWDKYTFGTARVVSIRTFLKCLPSAQIMEAMDIAEGRIFADNADKDWKRWKYFCGVCWSMIRGPKGG